MKKLSKKEWLAVILGLVVVGLVFGFGPGFFFYNQYVSMQSGNVLGEDTATNQNMTNQNNEEVQPATPEGLVIIDTLEGTGAIAAQGSTITVHYTGVFANGTKFDSSLDRGVPFSFTLGSGAVIQGWDQGLIGMKEGGKRRLVIPPQLGYGMADYGPIPGGSTLFFEVELLEVR